MKSPPYLQVHYCPEYGLISSQWLRVVNSAEYRKALVKVCQQLQSSNARRWLIDLSHSASPNMSDQNWTVELLGHRLPQTKLRKLALVLPDDLFFEVVVERVSYNLLSMSDYKFQIAQFSDLETAQQWLISFNDPEEGLFRNISKSYSTQVLNSGDQAA